MKHTPQSDIGFAHAVRYRDAMLHAWMKRTGRGNSYKPEDVPAYIDQPTNEERSRAEVILFKLNPLKHGESYTAYLSKPRADGWRGAITTFTGDVLANVTRLTSFRSTVFSTDSRGSFWAEGIDGRIYYGRHNGKGMYCRMRLAKYRDVWHMDVDYGQGDGWEHEVTEFSARAIREQVHTYRANAPEYPTRVRKAKELQT